MEQVAPRGFLQRIELLEEMGSRHVLGIVRPDSADVGEESDPEAGVGHDPFVIELDGGRARLGRPVATSKVGDH
jgi:hypothetical protein